MNDENPPDFTKLFAKMKTWRTKDDYVKHLLESLEKVNNDRWDVERDNAFLRHRIDELEEEVAELRRKNLRN